VKRLILFFSLILSILPFPTHAQALITISQPSTRLADGRFLDNTLAISLNPGGALDRSLLVPRTQQRIWAIDPALLEEISDLADGYVYLDTNNQEIVVEEFPLAIEWLDRLRFLSRNDRVVSLTYGAPSLSFLNSSAPGELGIYQQLSQARLSLILGRAVDAPGPVQSATNAPLVAKNSYTSLRKTMRVVNSLVTTSDVETLRLGIAKTLNPALDKESAVLMTRSYATEVKRFENRIRISPGNYTITASRYDLPVTIINDFNQQVSVDLDITTTNSRVLVTQVPRVTIDASSQVQIKIPIDVIASGDTALRLQLRTPRGSAIGEIERIPLRLAVISPITTWFTTGMAIILLLAAVIQSVRRVKRRKQHE
jgi:hypothetical protein